MTGVEHQAPRAPGVKEVPGRFVFFGSSVALQCPPWSASERLCFRFSMAVSALLFLAYAIFSTGYLQPDEYFQTVEFASMKLGLTDPADLPWEFSERMRSFLQPAIYTGVARIAAWMGIVRPANVLLLFRLLSGVLAWSALWTLIVAGRRWVAGEDDRLRLYVIGAFLWPLPLLGVRTSSETLATSALCFGIALLEWRADACDRRTRFGFAALAGFALGLCFLIRFTSGVMAAGAGLWYLRRRDGRLSLVAGLAPGIALALCLGVLADRWGYGATAFPVFSYLYQNFVLGRAATYGTDPFYAYLYLPLVTPMAPFVLFLLAATLLAWARRSGHVLAWATAPYVALLCLVAHKETRFLFPLAPFLPFFIVFALAVDPPFGARFASFLARFGKGRRLLMGFAFNCCGLLASIFLPLQPEFPIYELLEVESEKARGSIEISLAHAPDNFPFWRAGLHQSFLEPKNLGWIDASLADLDARRSRGESFWALIDRKSLLQEPAAWIKSHCVFVASSWPRWLLPLDFHQWQERSYYWELHRCDDAKPAVVGFSEAEL